MWGLNWGFDQNTDCQTIHLPDEKNFFTALLCNLINASRTELSESPQPLPKESKIDLIVKKN